MIAEAIDPLGSYDLVVHSIPPVGKKNIKLLAGKHTTIAVDAPQGSLELKMNGYNEYKDLKSIVRKEGEIDVLVVQDFNQVQKYITGMYDLEILTLPRTYVKGVNIAQSKTTTVEIPQAGLATISINSKGFGSVFRQKGEELVWVCNLNTTSTRESIVLQPGLYKVIFRPLNSRLSIYTKEESFEIESGQSTQVKL